MLALLLSGVDCDISCVLPRAVHSSQCEVDAPQLTPASMPEQVDQPTMQRAKLSPAQAEFVQGRVEQLHRMLAAGGDASGKWIKERGTAEQLATVDAAQLVTPPEGLEIGYVPVTLYEGIQKPPGCTEVHL
jgi:hypothetical protein|eukprot:COSAG01_NODE_554_length_15534_cov_101.167541_5_plen_131_part_00